MVGFTSKPIINNGGKNRRQCSSCREPARQRDEEKWRERRGAEEQRSRREREREKYQEKSRWSTRKHDLDHMSHGSTQVVVLEHVPCHLAPSTASMVFTFRLLCLSEFEIVVSAERSSVIPSYFTGKTNVA